MAPPTYLQRTLAEKDRRASFIPASYDEMLVVRYGVREGNEPVGAGCATDGGASVSSIATGQLLVLLPLTLASCWFFSAPVLVNAANPRLRVRNKDHFAKLVKFSRVWGIAAIVAGVAVGKLM